MKIDRDAYDEAMRLLDRIDFLVDDCIRQLREISGSNG